VVLERVHAAAAGLFVVAIIVQVFLAGAALANLGGSGDFATHIEFGYTGIGIAALAAVWYFASDAIPAEFVQAMPYVITLVVLALASQRLRPPAADGQPYRKGEG